MSVSARCHARREVKFEPKYPGPGITPPPGHLDTASQKTTKKGAVQTRLFRWVHRKNGKTGSILKKTKTWQPESLFFITDLHTTRPKHEYFHAHCILADCCRNFAGFERSVCMTRKKWRDFDIFTPINILRRRLPWVAVRTGLLGGGLYTRAKHNLFVIFFVAMFRLGRKSE